MSIPFISVVIPVFNRANCVGNSVESVLAQTFKNFEVIVVDDGSTDNTAEVLACFGNRIRLIRQENRGVATARNAGIRAAQGNWIAFLDSDDQWRFNKLERQVGYLEKYTAKICFTRCMTDRGDLMRDIEDVVSITKEPELYWVEDAIDSVCHAQCHPYLPSLLIEKQLLERVGLFDESLYVAEDTLLFFKLSFLSGFIYIDNPLVVVSRSATVNSLTFDTNPAMARKRFSSYLRVQAEVYWRMLENFPERASLARNRLGYFISRRAELACVASQFRHARVMAKDGIFLAGDLRTFVRCVGIFLFPSLFQSCYRKKWIVEGKHQALPHRRPLNSGKDMIKKTKGATASNHTTRKFLGILARKQRWRLSWRGWLIFVTAGLLIVGLLLLNIQPFLAKTQRVNANTLIVEGWIHEYAIRSAANEFKAGSYQRILTTGGPVVGTDGYTNDFNTSASVGAELLKKIGVPDEFIQMAPSHVAGRDRTYSSAIALRDWFREHGMTVRSINVLTEDAHARRTQLLFQKAFGSDVAVGIISVPDPDYDAKHWWRYSEGVREVLGEGVAYLYARIFFHPSENFSNQ